MVLKISDLDSWSLTEAWKNYSIDYHQVRQDIAKLVKKLAILNRNYRLKIDQLHSTVEVPSRSGEALSFRDVSRNANEHELGANTSADSLPSTTKSSQFEDKDEDEDEDTPRPNYSSSPSSSSSSSSNASSINLLSQHEMSSKEVQAKTKHLTKAYKEKKAKLIANFISSSLLKQLKTVNLFVNLKNYQLIKNFQSNSNNYRRNHKNILSEIFSINRKLKEYQALLASEAAVNNDFILQLDNLRNNSSGGDSGAVPSLDTDNIKLLNLQVVSRNLGSLSPDNQKLQGKVDEFKNDIFLNIKSFVLFQKATVIHLLHFFNKTILKSSEFSADESAWLAEDGQKLTYVDLLHLVKHKGTLKQSQKLIPEDFFHKAQQHLLLSFDERLDIYKYIFQDILHAPFNESAVDKIFGNTIYEREFIYFGKLTDALVENLDRSVENPAEDGTVKYPNILDSRFLVRDKLSCYIPGKSVADERSNRSSENSYITFWNLDLLKQYKLISGILQVLNHNTTLESKVVRLLDLVSNQRSLVYDSNQLNYIYRSNNIGKYSSLKETIEYLSSEWTYHQKKHDRDFDLGAANCFNSGWFLVPSEYTFEVSFLLDKLFPDNNEIPENGSSIKELIDGVFREVDPRSNSLQSGGKVSGYTGTQKQTVSFFDSPSLSSKPISSLKPTEVLSSYDDGTLMAVGISNSLGKITSSTFSSKISRVLHNDAKMASQLLSSSDYKNDKCISSIVNECFGKNETEFENFQKLFKQDPLNITRFTAEKQRYFSDSSVAGANTQKPPKNPRHPKFWISLYSNVGFFQDNKLKHEFPYTLLEIKWDSNLKFPEEIIKLINSDYFYEIPYFDPYLYSITIFNIASTEDKEIRRAEWFHKLVDRKFKLKSIVDNRLMRTRQKVELVIKLQEKEEEKRRGISDANSARNQNRYWNEFDDNPEEWGNNNGFYVDLEANNHGEFISDAVINFLIDLTTKIENISSVLKKRVHQALHPHNGYLVDNGHNDDAHYLIRGSHRNLQSAGSFSSTYNYDSSDDDRSLVFNQSTTKCGYGSLGNANGAATAYQGYAGHNHGDAPLNESLHLLARQATMDYEHERNLELLSDPEYRRAHKHDIVATFLYFVLPTIAAIITGSSLGIIYSVVLDPSVEASFFTLLTLVCSLIVSFLLASFSLVFLFGRISPAPVHHYIWVWSIFLAVLTSIIIVLTEFVEI